jgi:hypothetical protein
MHIADRLAQTAPACRAFAAKIEEMLVQRRREAQYRPHKWKRWTQEEFCDVAYSSYKSLLNGRVHYPPRQSVILDIAEYLECTPAQRNALLLAAGYAPQHPYLEGVNLQAALTFAEQVMHDLPLPAYVITRDWSVAAFNTGALRLFGVSAAQFMQMPVDERNILHQIFDPAGPVRARLSHSAMMWERAAMRNIYLFKFDNILSQHEPWYQDRVTRLQLLPDFASYWHLVEIDTHTESIFHMVDIVGPDEELLHVRPLRIRPCNYDYPQVWAYQPADARTQEVLEAMEGEDLK